MKLRNVRVQKYQNIVDSGDVEIDEDITCLVGKNESGKTAFLQALHKLNPHHSSEFKDLYQYPRWKFKFDERKGKVNSDPVISAKFDLEEHEIIFLEEEFGDNVINSKQLTVSKFYNNTTKYELDVDELQVLINKVLTLSEESQLRKATSKKKSLNSFKEAWIEAWSKVDSPSDKENEINNFLNTSLSEKLEEILSSYLSTIFYFGEYSRLPGRIKLEDFLRKDVNDLEEEERTANALLELAGANRESIKTDEFEDRIAELESSASAITQEVLQYWSQNEFISVDFKIDPEIEDVGNGRKQKTAHYLDIRLRDFLHGDVTINFDQRSSGFRWFFSFLVAFSEFENSEKSLIILLDEPGLSLHARAQNDFLKFIRERLGKEHQVLYTTHSPFMIEPKNLEEVRLVEDKTTRIEKIGSKITSSIFSTNYDTIFPLQSALGYDMAQNLFVGKHNVIVEGTSDFAYLNVMSRFLEENNKAHFDFTEITLTPVGGASKIATFVALLGQHLDAVVFMDADKKESQRVSDLIERGLLENEKYLTPADFLDEMQEADIEDLFKPEDYLKLYNDAFDDDLKMSDLNGQDPIVRRIARAKGDFDHGKPADLFLRNSDEYLENFSDETIDKFEEVISKLNETIER